MIVLISSKQLLREFKNVNFQEEYVCEVGADEEELIIDFSNGKTLRIECYITDKELIIKQDSRRWDWLIRTVSRIDEQPIVLQIYNNKLNLVISY